MLSYKDSLEYCNSAQSKLTIYKLKKINFTCTDQTERMHSLAFAFVVSLLQNQFFSHQVHICILNSKQISIAIFQPYQKLHCPYEGSVVLEHNLICIFGGQTFNTDFKWYTVLKLNTVAGKSPIIQSINQSINQPINQSSKQSRQ